MKITFQTTKTAILANLGHQLKEIQSSLDTARTDLAEVQKKADETKLHNPYLSSELAAAKSRVKAWETAEAELQDTIGLIESGEETVTVETEAKE